MSDVLSLRERLKRKRQEELPPPPIRTMRVSDPETGVWQRHSLGHVCEWCGKEFTIHDRKRKYCTPICKNRSLNARRAERRKQRGHESLVPAKDERAGFGLQCACGGRMDIESTRDAPGGIRRRRQCRSCGERITTYERIEGVGAAVPPDMPERRPCAYCGMPTTFRTAAGRICQSCKPKLVREKYHFLGQYHRDRTYGPHITEATFVVKSLTEAHGTNGRGRIAGRGPASEPDHAPSS